MLDLLKFKNIFQFFYYVYPISIVFFFSFYITGFFLGLISIPLDFQQGEMYKLIYLHVPSAWLSLLCYAIIVLLSMLYLLLKLDIFFFLAHILSKYGMLFSLITLLTGSLWGKPLWGSFWVWDARLTSMLILFFMYLGYYLFIFLLNNNKNYKQLASIFAIFGFINLPIIKYSVEWWATMHQNSSLNFSQISFVHTSVYTTLLVILISFLNLIFLFVLLELKIKYINLKKNSSYSE